MNIWVIILPVTGIILVALFAVFCVCRYTCRFISFCTKQCEKSHRNNKPVTVKMPSHQDIHDLMLRQSSPYCGRKSEIPSVPSDEEKGLLTPHQSANRLSIPGSEGDTASMNNYNTSQSEKSRRHRTSKTNLQIEHEGQVKATPIHHGVDRNSTTWEGGTTDLNISASSRCDINNCAEISEISAPHVTISSNNWVI